MRFLNDEIEAIHRSILETESALMRAIQTDDMNLAETLRIMLRQAEWDAEALEQNYH